MALINIMNLTFCYDGGYDNIFEDVSFQIDTDWKLGFIGRNGRGKTTFLKLLMGKYEYRGNISASVCFDYFPFEPKDKSADTIDIVKDICHDFQQWELNRELSLLDVDEGVLYRPFNTLSFGERTKIMIAALFLKENNFLLIDEPTNHLDITARRIVSKYLKSKKGFILVSHDREFLDNCIDHTLSINRADIEVQRGNYSSWQRNKEMRDNYELAENERLKKDIKNLTEAARRTSQWSDKVEKTKFGQRLSGIKPDKGYIGHKAAKMMKRSKAIESRRVDAAEEKSKLLKNIETSDKLFLKPLKHHDRRLIEVRDLSLSYGDNTVCRDIGFTVGQGGRVALCGKNGCGKSSVLKLLMGENIAYTGSVNTASNLKISYVSQDTSFLKGGIKDFVKSRDIEEPLFNSILRKLGFSRTQLEKDMTDFSEGQKKKVLIAGSLCESAHIYIWDEPLNFIDVISRQQIEELILESDPAMLFVEHDSMFLEKIATEIIMIKS